jgi:hypothetical protein
VPPLLPAAAGMAAAASVAAAAAACTDSTRGSPTSTVSSRVQSMTHENLLGSTSGTKVHRMKLMNRNVNSASLSQRQLSARSCRIHPTRGRRNSNSGECANQAKQRLTQPQHHSAATPATIIDINAVT